MVVLSNMRFRAIVHLWLEYCIIFVYFQVELQYCAFLSVELKVNEECVKRKALLPEVAASCDLLNDTNS